jgi:cysteine-rich repeat protein
MSRPNRARDRLAGALLWLAVLHVVVLFAAGCAEAETGLTTASSSSTSGAGGQGGMGGEGGDGAAASSSSGGGMGGEGGGVGGGGGAGGEGGMGGAGGGFVPPVGTPDHPLEVEQNNLKATANPLAPMTKGFTGSIHPLGDIDIYSVEVPFVGSSLKVRLSDGMGGCPPNTNALVRVLAPNNKFIATKKKGCPVLEPPQTLGLASLPSGTYHIQVESAAIEVIPFYVLDIEVVAPGCGDKLIQPSVGEQCDDGNLIPGDGCDAMCKIEVVCGDAKVHVLAGEQCDDGNAAPGDGCSDTCQIEGAKYLTEVEPNELPAPNSLNGYDGAVAAIIPFGDQDFFTFDVTIPNSSVFIEVSDGKGGCPTAFDSKIYFYDAAQTLLASNDDDGPEKCSLIAPTVATPQVAAAASNLAMGTYTVKVEKFQNNGEQAFYVLKVTVKPPGCGDLVIQPSEQCDDGNAAPGDGCSDTCQIELACGDGKVHAIGGEQCDDTNALPGDGCSDTCQIEGKSFLNETEPNDENTPNSVNGYDGAFGAIFKKGDQDYFSFDVAVPGSTVVLRVSNGINTLCPPGFDSRLYLYNDQNTQIAFDDDDSDESCSLITPLNDPAAQSLTPGTYTVKVEEYNNNNEQLYYALEVTVSPPGCGDGIVQAGEQCDDFNSAPGDGCSDTCQFELNLTTETESNDDPTLADKLDGFDGAIASIDPMGDLDYFSVDVTVPGSSLMLTVSNGVGGCPGGVDTQLRLYNSQAQQIAYDDDSGDAACSMITPSWHAGAANLPAGTYTFRVNEFSNGEIEPFYVIEVEILLPVCGDGLTQPGEECDDGNPASGDGCSPMCHAEAPYESESNNTMAEANVLWPQLSHWVASIFPKGDIDWFVFNHPGGGASLKLETHAASDPSACPGDTTLHLVNSSGQDIAFDDDGGVGTCSLLDSAMSPALMNLPIDTYYVWVQYHGNLATLSNYQLTLTIQ